MVTIFCCYDFGWIKILQNLIPKIRSLLFSVVFFPNYLNSCQWKKNMNLWAKNLKYVNWTTYLQVQKWGHTRGGLRPDLIWCSLFYLKNSIFNEMSRRSHWAAHVPFFVLYALPQPQSDFSYIHTVHPQNA